MRGPFLLPDSPRLSNFVVVSPMIQLCEMRVDIDWKVFPSIVDVLIWSVADSEFRVWCIDECIMLSSIQLGVLIGLIVVTLIMM